MTAGFRAPDGTSGFELSLYRHDVTLDTYRRVYGTIASSSSGTVVARSPGRLVGQAHLWRVWLATPPLESHGSVVRCTRDS